MFWRPVRRRFSDDNAMHASPPALAVVYGRRLSLGIGIGLACVAGCVGRQNDRRALPVAAAAARRPAESPAPEKPTQIVPASHVSARVERADAHDLAAESNSHASVEPATAVFEEELDPSNSDGEFDGQDRLDVELLVARIEERNPTLEAMQAAWRAAAARYPQAIALDDPMVDVMFAPASFAKSSNVPDSWAIEAGQKFPAPGKRAFRGRAASANARAAMLDSEDYRLQLGLLGRLAHADYRAATHTLALNDTEQKLAEELRVVAQIRYETNQAPQQDVLQAAVEAAEVRKRRVGIQRQKRTAIARINALLHRHPAADLPPPSDDLPADEAVADLDELMGLAAQNRPDLASQAARIRTERASYGLAQSDYRPDFELYGRYDQMWLDPEQRGSVGLRLNAPLQQGRRRAAVREALARLSQARAEYQARLAQIRFDVQASRERLIESRQVLELFREEIVQLAEQTAVSARAGYETGTVNFLTLLAAQRQLISYRQQQVEAAAEYRRQLAELERAIGASLPARQPAE